MKSRITFFSATWCLMAFLFLSNTVTAQDHPMANMIGVWDMVAYKTEPAELLAQMGTASKTELTFEWSVDKKGVIHTNKTTFNGETQYASLTHFHDFTTNTGHILGAFGTGKTTYPDENTVSIQQFDFDGKLLNKQEFVFQDEDEVDGVIEGTDGVKIWVKMTRRK